MNEAQTEAIAAADAHLNNAGMPTYTEMAEALKKLRDTGFGAAAFVEATRLLSRLPSRRGS